MLRQRSIFLSVHPKAVSYSDLGAKGDTELVGVASLSATFEGHCKFYLR